MRDALKKLQQFHRVFACAMQSRPGLVDEETRKLRQALMQEELAETLAAMESGDMIEIADGLADLCYVAIGTAVTYGIPLDEVFAEVHRSNMTKARLCGTCAGAGRVMSSNKLYPTATGGTPFTACTDCSGTGYQVRYREDGKVLKPADWRPPSILPILQRALREAQP